MNDYSPGEMPGDSFIDGLNENSILQVVLAKLTLVLNYPVDRQSKTCFT
jgi:hypothetical protein